MSAVLINCNFLFLFITFLQVAYALPLCQCTDLNSISLTKTSNFGHTQRQLKKSVWPSVGITNNLAHNDTQKINTYFSEHVTLSESMNKKQQ